MNKVTRTIKDMHKAGILLNPNDKMRFRVDITTYGEHAITGYGKYFATKKAAQAYLKEQS